MKELFLTWVLKKTTDGKVQFFRSLIVGGIASVADIAVIALCREVLLLTDFIAVAAGFVFGLVVNFLLSRFWVFPASRYGRNTEFIMFAIIGVIGLLLTEAIIWAFGMVFPDNDFAVYIGKLFAIVAVFFWNFLARKKFVYK